MSFNAQPIELGMSMGKRSGSMTCIDDVSNSIKERQSNERLRWNRQHVVWQRVCVSCSQECLHVCAVRRLGKKNWRFSHTLGRLIHWRDSRTLPRQTKTCLQPGQTLTSKSVGTTPSLAL